MFRIILNQILLKKQDISVYSKISPAMAWGWNILISFVIAFGYYLVDNDIVMLIVDTIMTTILMYVGYLVVKWWLQRSEKIEIDTKLWSLSVTSISVQMLFVLIALLPYPLTYKLIAMIIILIYSLIVVVNAIKSAYPISYKNLIISLLISFAITIFLAIVIGVFIQLTEVLLPLAMEQNV